jgi:hypothetical protein
MSRMDKDELKNELEHINKLLIIAHSNRRSLEEQRIISRKPTSDSITEDLNETNKIIQELNERKDTLERQSVEEYYSLEEAEYRLLASRLWKEGVLSTEDKALMELTRIQLRIPVKRAKQIENIVKSSLVSDMLQVLYINTEDRIGWIEGNIIYKAMILDINETANFLANKNIYSNSQKYLAETDERFPFFIISNDEIIKVISGAFMPLEAKSLLNILVKKLEKILNKKQNI